VFSLASCLIKNIIYIFEQTKQKGRQSSSVKKEETQLFSFSSRVVVFFFFSSSSRQRWWWWMMNDEWWWHPDLKKKKICLQNGLKRNPFRYSKGVFFCNRDWEDWLTDWLTDSRHAVIIIIIASYI
jgi:hypothetical protein